MRLFTRFTTFAAVAVLMLGLATSAAAQLVAGKDYRLIDPPQPTDSGKKVEVLEFFWYGCPHCYALQSSLTAWLKRKPADVEFKHVPAVFQDSWVPLAKAFYAIDAMGLTDKLHQDVYAAIHEKKTQLGDPKILFDWVAGKGVDRAKFVATYNSFAVQGRAKRSIDLTRDYDIPGTPALTVDGKYLAAPSLTLKADRSIDYDRFFRVLDQLIALARKNHGGK
jgi:thiol:disulfide interchange protein DsbA